MSSSIKLRCKADWINVEQQTEVSTRKLVWIDRKPRLAISSKVETFEANKFNELAKCQWNSLAKDLEAESAWFECRYRMQMANAFWSKAPMLGCTDAWWRMRPRCWLTELGRTWRQDVKNNSNYRDEEGGEFHKKQLTMPWMPPWSKMFWGNRYVYILMYICIYTYI